MYSFSVIISKDWYCCLDLPLVLIFNSIAVHKGDDFICVQNISCQDLDSTCRNLIWLYLNGSRRDNHTQSPGDRLKEVSSDGSLHSLPSARGRSWALPVPRPGAGLWRRAASWYPSGGSKCHHDVSEKSIFLFFFFVFLQYPEAEAASSSSRLTAPDKCQSPFTRQLQ